jgi:hypothetical protein
MPFLYKDYSNIPLVIARKTSRILVCDGDSITDDQPYDYPDYAAPLIGANAAVDAAAYRIYNVSVSGETVATMNTNAPTVVDPKYDSTKAVNIYSVLGGTNDIRNGGSPSSAAATYGTLCSGRRAVGFKVIAWTLLPAGFYNQAQLTPARVAAFNAIVRANWTSYADVLIDIQGQDLQLGSAYSGDDKSYFTDGVHPCPTDSQLVGFGKYRMAMYLVRAVRQLDPIFRTGALLVGNVFGLGAATTGASSGGTTVYLSGYGFSSADTVKWGGVTMTSTLLDPTHRSFVTPAHTGAGTAQDIVVSNGSSSSTYAAAFAYGAPLAATVSPSAVPAATPTAIQIQGANFDSSCAFYLGVVNPSNQLTSVTHDNGSVGAPEQVVFATTPVLSANVYDLIAVNSDGTTGTLSSAITLYSALSPIVSSITVTSTVGCAYGVLTGGDAVTITGSNFLGATGAGVKVGASSLALTSFTVVNTNTITGVIPDGTTLVTSTGGLADVQVTNGSGTGSLTNGWYYFPSGLILGVDPQRGYTFGSSTLVNTPILAGGSGYSSGPSVAFSGGGGSGASGNTGVSAGAVTSANLLSGGSGYTFPATVTLSGGGGSGASVISTLPVTTRTAWLNGSESQVSGPAQPLYYPTAFGGRDAEFTSGSRYMIGTLTSSYTGNTLTALCLVKRTVAGNGRVFALIRAAAVTDEQDGVLSFSCEDNAPLTMARNSAFQANGPSALPLNTLSAVSVRFTGSQAIVRLNGTDGSPGSSSGNFQIEQYLIGIGKSGNVYGGSAALPGAIQGFFLVWSRALVAGDFTSLGAWTARDFGGFSTV